MVEKATTADVTAHFSATWLEHADRLEAQLEPVDAILLDAAALRPGERVLDVGCGRGPTTVKAAAAVGLMGRTIGIDLAPTLIDAARTRTRDDDSGPIDWVVGDAQTFAFGPGSMDAVISRFGTLFFEDPVAAFANLFGATRPGGRLAIAVWQPRDASELFERSLSVAVATASALGHELRVAAPDAGPFAFGREPAMRAVLDAAGWTVTGFTRHRLRMYAGGPGSSPEQTTAINFAAGPLRTVADDLPADVRPAIERAVAEDLAQCADTSGIPLDGAIAIVQARRPRQEFSRV
jgi:SAM-dependent methyltransferase